MYREMDLLPRGGGEHHGSGCTLVDSGLSKRARDLLASADSVVQFSTFKGRCSATDFHGRK